MKKMSGVIETKVTDLHCPGQPPQSRTSFKQQEIALLLLESASGGQAGDASAEHNYRYFLRQSHDWCLKPSSRKERSVHMSGSTLIADVFVQ
jgi:hypothetical protein